MHGINSEPCNKVIIRQSDGAFAFWSVDTGKELLKLYPLGESDWVILHPSGLFDASPQAMKWMYYLVGEEVIELDQFKERYYEPGLFERVMAQDGRGFRDVKKFDSVEMYPEAWAEIKNDNLQIQLKERNGGIGKLSLFINNKEVLADANTKRETSLSIDLKQFWKYYRSDTTNIIGIRSYNAEGWLKSQSFNLEYKPDFASKKGDGAEELTFGFDYQPSFYAVIVGTSDYSGTQLDLRYADKDAGDMYNAIRQTAPLLFGEEQVHLDWFSTDTKSGSKLSSKENIRAAFDSIAVKAKPEDVVTVYFSGHGVTFGGTENEQFYYLTKDVNTGDLSDPAIRNSYAISTEELTRWVNAIPAQKQVMILDACSSGKAAEDLLAVRQVPTSQIRALDRMKDRTGMFVLAGSAADRVSYEASQFGQGLLTYSLLLGMSGAKLREGKYVDVMELFQFARDKVPEFAGQIGGIQTPMLASPMNASSFDIGLVTADVHIPLEEIKPVFVRSNFQEENSFRDVIGLSKALDENLLNTDIDVAASRGLIFVDVNEYENAYSVNGRYSLNNDEVNLQGRLFKGKEPTGVFEVSGSRNQMQVLIDDILKQVVGIMNQ